MSGCLHIQLWVELSVVRRVSGETLSGGHCSSWSDLTHDTDPGTVIGFSNHCTSIFTIFGKVASGHSLQNLLYISGCLNTKVLVHKTSSLMGLVSKDPENRQLRILRYIDDRILSTDYMHQPLHLEEHLPPQTIYCHVSQQLARTPLHPGDL